MGSQERALRRGVDIIVACPGRLLDHMRGPHADFSSLTHLVLDEADNLHVKRRPQRVVARMRGRECPGLSYLPDALDDQPESGVG